MNCAANHIQNLLQIERKSWLLIINPYYANLKFFDNFYITVSLPIETDITEKIFRKKKVLKVLWTKSLISLNWRRR